MCSRARTTVLRHLLETHARVCTMYQRKGGFFVKLGDRGLTAFHV